MDFRGDALGVVCDSDDVIMTPQEAEDAKVRGDMQKFGRFCDSQLPFGWGFVFLAFPYGQGGRMNYIANAERADVVRAMYEFIERSKEQWGEHLPEESAAAEDEQLGRARQRIAELEGQHEGMLLKHAREQNTALELLEAALKQIGQDKELLARAADALTVHSLRGECRDLIAELRKAAQ